MSTFTSKSRRLAQPSSPKFDPTKWSALLNACTDATDKERCQYHTALLLGQMMAEIRAERAKLATPGLTRTEATTLACTSLNVSARHVLSLAEKGFASPSSVPIAHGRAVRNGLTVDGKKHPPVDSMIERLVDSGARWLYDANRTQGSGSATQVVSDLSKLLDPSIYLLETQAIVYCHMFEHLDWVMVQNDGLLFRPSDLLEGMFREAILWRAANSANTILASWMTTWQSRPLAERTHLLDGIRVVQSKPTDPRTLEIVDADPTKTVPPQVLLLRKALEDSYAAPLADESFPNYAGVTLKTAIQAWGLLADMADAWVRHDLPDGGVTHENASEFTARRPRDIVRSILKEGLRCDDATVEGVLELLTHDQDASYSFDARGLWAAPIVPVSGTDDVCLVLAPLLGTNILWLIDPWLAKGGLSDDSLNGKKGTAIEAAVRANLVGAIEHNHLLSTSCCVPHAIKKEAFYGEEIDALVKLGSALLVIEVKTFGFSGEPRGIAQTNSKITKAIEQVERKAKAVAAAPDVTARLLGLSETEAAMLDVMPIVATNHGSTTAALTSETVVTDTRFLSIYLRGNMLHMGGARSSDGSVALDLTETLYESEADAVGRLRRTLCLPPLLERTLHRLVPSRYPYPSEERRAFDVWRLDQEVEDDMTRLVQRHFDGLEDAIGKTFELDGRTITVWPAATDR